MRLIDADKLLRDIEHYNLSDGKFQHWVEVQPTVDAVPIIRCQDCRNYAGEGWYCAWNMIASAEGFCFHANEDPEYSDD